MATIDPKNNQIAGYSALYDGIPVNAVTKGEMYLKQDTLCFWFNDASAGIETTLVFRMAGVDAQKRIGTGEEILSGDRLYYYLSAFFSFCIYCDID